MGITVAADSQSMVKRVQIYKGLHHQCPIKDPKDSEQRRNHKREYPIKNNYYFKDIKVWTFYKNEKKTT